MFQSIDNRQHFPELEKEILEIWQKQDIFQKSIKDKSGSDKKKEFIFYDGPPFATGLPHYGHLLASIIKDIIPRYQTMQGRKVNRRFGWDCHGLPVEMEMQTQLGLKSGQDIINHGIDKFNEACRKIVLRYTSEWEKTIRRIGRWVDFENDYKTMGLNFMESIWWVFKSLYDKELIYQGFKVLPYSWKAGTSLSNFEANLNYKDAQDPAITVKFPVVGERDTYLLAWTTTPWTLISNLALCVNENIEYVKISITIFKYNNEKTKIKEDESFYYLAKNIYNEQFITRWLMMNDKDDYKKITDEFLYDGEYMLGEIPNIYDGEGMHGDRIVVARKCKEEELLRDLLDIVDYSDLNTFVFSDNKSIIKISLIDKEVDLTNKTYTPLFPYTEKSIDTRKAYPVLSDDFVSDTEGTGIVHLAPAYGEDDYRVGKQNGIGLYDAVDENGNFKKEIGFVAGMNVKEADKEIINQLKKENLLFKHETINHSYPFCWRTDTPLIYKAIGTWFVKVENLKENMVSNNQTTHWVPGHIKEGRFGKWIENAKDWDIGRNRFWGTPIPIWKSDEGDVLCFGDIKSLEEMSGESIRDLHKHFIDKITFTHQGKTYRRVSQVLDCWFESGSMPYAQNHYPFENKALFEKNFPADFIAEGLDQTRGWFYTLSVISSGLMGKKAFKNVIVNGLILAEDGKKMSKRLKNYPDPNYIIDTYGADALRLYLISSGVVSGEYLKFSEEGVKDVLKSIILPLWNSFSFFVSYANIDNIDGYDYRSLSSDLKNPLDRWILSYLEQLNEEIIEAMEKYELKKSVPPIVVFVEKLTNWYIRRSRRRFWKSENDDDKKQAYYTLYSVLLKLSKLIAPFVPFLSEKIYLVLTQNKGKESVHLENYPKPNANKREPSLESEMREVERAVVLGRSLRSRHQLKIRQPLSEMIIITKNEFKKSHFAKPENIAVILDELNIKHLSLSDNEESFLILSAKANFKTLGKKMGSRMKEVANVVAKLKASDLAILEKAGGFSIKVGKEEVILNRKDVLIQRSQKEGRVALNEDDITVVLNTELSSTLIEEGLARDFVNRIQKERKEMNLQYTDRVQLKCIADPSLKEALNNFSDYIQKEVLANDFVFVQSMPDMKRDKNEVIFELGDKTCQVLIKKVD